MFTGDASGEFLFKALYDLGLASQSKAIHATDDLKLNDVIITAVVRCAPPQNKPAPREIQECSAYFRKEIQLLDTVRVVVALGKIAHDAFIKMKADFEGLRPSNFPFKHGQVHRFRDRPFWLVDVYHPSRQNTNTGRLTMPMFKEGLGSAGRLAAQAQGN